QKYYWSIRYLAHTFAICPSNEFDQTRFEKEYERLAQEFQKAHGPCPDDWEKADDYQSMKKKYVHENYTPRPVNTVEELQRYHEQSEFYDMEVTMAETKIKAFDLFRQQKNKLLPEEPGLGSYNAYTTAEQLVNQGLPEKLLTSSTP